MGWLTGLGLYRNVGVGGFPIYRSGDFAVVKTFEVDIQECNLIVYLFFPSKFDSRMDRVENVIKGSCWVLLLLARCAAEACATRELRLFHNSPTVVHVQGDVFWYRGIGRLSFVNG